MFNFLPTSQDLVTGQAALSRMRGEMAVSTNKVFRLSKCPGDAGEADLRVLLSNALGDVSAGEIKIGSLARGHGLDSTGKTATLLFTKLPSLLRGRPCQTSWRVPLRRDSSFGNVKTASEVLVLDTHFEGFTPLNDPEDDQEAIDCIVISGLASHPFGSWQEKGSDKSYMWVRDTLPKHLRNVRAILYGYDTTLVNSRSFQSIGEIAGTLRDRLIPMAYSTVRLRPLVFLAHSLGGIILKRTLVMLADSGPEGGPLLGRIYGGIFFGVPNHGMDQKGLLTAVWGQPNLTLVNNLATGSTYLTELDKSFDGIGNIHRMKFNWAYETRETRTVSKTEDGSFARKGPSAVLVTRESATRGMFGSDSRNTFAIDKDHSDMVKYSDQDPVCEEVLVRLDGICASGRPLSHGNDIWSHRMPSNRPGWDVSGAAQIDAHQDTWAQVLKETLYVPEMDGRYATIEERSPKTFEWIFDSSKTCFSKWLQQGDGLFWIQGKPGSGKSTLMRFIQKDERTERYLEGHDLISQPNQIIRCRHFFHSRGSPLQKSFEGLLRSLLYQILCACSPLAECLRPVLEEAGSWLSFPQGKSFWTSHSLRRCLHHILKQSLYDIKLFILLDALDEYDGTPEYVCTFLQNLLTSTGTRTQSKILFSSRPWESFQEHFFNVPSLRLQEHNKSDIVTYCENTVSNQDLRFRPALNDIIPEIVRRSEGVFIWVKYILEDMATAAAKGQDFEHLLVLLESLPTDLSDYYISVIRRINVIARRDAYALFQLVLSRTDNHRIDSMDAVFAHSVWSCSTYSEAQMCFNNLIQKWVTGSLKARFAAGTTFSNPYQRDDRFVRPRYLINRFGNAEGFERQQRQTLRLSGGLIHITKSSGLLQPDEPKDPVKAGLDLLVVNDVLPRRTATAMRPLFTSFTEEDKEPFLMEPSHQTVYEFIKRSDFKDLLLGNDAVFVHENRHTWLAKLFFAQDLLDNAGGACLLSELTTGRSMDGFINSIPSRVWKKMYEDDFMDFLKGADTMIDSPLRFAVIYGLTLYLTDALNRDVNTVRNTNDELILVAPARVSMIEQDLGEGRWRRYLEGEVFLSRHLEITRMVVRGGYSEQRTEAAFLKIMWIIAALTVSFDHISIRGRRFDSWSDRAAEAKAGVLIELGQDPNVQIAGVRSRHEFSRVRNTEVKWRPVHVASLGFTKTLRNAGANLNSEDGHGNTALDWLLAPWSTSKERKSRGLAHRLIEDKEIKVARDCWGKIAYLVQNGGVAKTTPQRVWRSFIARYSEALLKQSVAISLLHAADVQQTHNETKDPDLARGNIVKSASTSSMAIVTGFSDVVVREEAGIVTTYNNLWDDGNLLGSYFEDLEQARGHLSGLPVENLESEDIESQKRTFTWRRRH